MNEMAREWLEKAENDYDAAELTLHGREEPIIDAVCFHSQQCAEKYLTICGNDPLSGFGYSREDG